MILVHDLVRSHKLKLRIFPRRVAIHNSEYASGWRDPARADSDGPAPGASSDSLRTSLEHWAFTLVLSVRASRSRYLAAAPAVSITVSAHTAPSRWANGPDGSLAQHPRPHPVPSPPRTTRHPLTTVHGESDATSRALGAALSTATPLASGSAPASRALVAHRDGLSYLDRPARVSHRGWIVVLRLPDVRVRTS